MGRLVLLGGVPAEKHKTSHHGSSAWMHRATFDLVWLGVLILTPGVGVPAGPVCPAFPLRFRLGLSAGWSGQAGRGGARVAWNSWDQACSHGQCGGRCIRRRRAERASRAGMLISWARMVPVVALAWKAEARQPAARVRLNAIAASTSQALFAANEPDVI